MDIISTALLLFFVIDSLGNIPIFIAILRHLEPMHRLRIIVREMVIALLVMLSFLYFGKYLLTSLHLALETLSIAGGLLLFLIALRMIFPQPKGIIGLPKGEEPFLFPLAVPLMAGPSTLATILMLAARHQKDLNTLVLVILLAWTGSLLVLVLTAVHTHWLSKKGLNVLERLMGVVLLIISIQMMLEGFRTYFSSCFASIDGI